ncbi:high-affinity zinc uptake system protein znuA [Alcanivorax xiamenensis]|uniref:High-affinity zinc uptake system protein ZnuA n=1 Tax=Alcanivorax xiamenensis TaxID=1177156 RepID=A0ABQ6YE03_9GAMM|nr:metal ABC transporter substrate-binding protein [Alcanivorax xiamenensis]KAF0808556.1 high-affinity zinc uptake system protein znuA [Alcanivorax xiamenensis]
MRCFLLILLFLAGLPVSSPVAAATIVASVEPLAMALRQLYGDQAEVVTLLAPNQNPHHLSLSPRQALAVRDADLVVWLGEDAEPPVATLIRRRSGPSLALADLPGAEVRDGTAGHDHTDDHAGHSHSQIDPHLWLGVLLARALSEQDRVPLPATEPGRFIAALDVAEQAIATRLAPLQQRPWLTYHHPYAYFQHHFGLADPLVISEQLGAGPSSRRFVLLAAGISKSDIRCALLEPEAQGQLVKRLCPECELIRLDPLGRDHTDSGYSDWLEQVVTPAFSACLQAGQ